MKILAWYTLIWSILGAIVCVKDDKAKSLFRIVGALIYLPVIVFTLKYIGFI